MTAIVNFGPRLAVAAAGVACVGLWLLVPGHTGYDAEYALLWGQELAHGHLPTLTAAYAPTPHPLANLVGAVLSPLGHARADDVWLLLCQLSLGLVGIGAWRLGSAIGGPRAGALAALLVVSRPALVASAFRGSVDVPALALVLLALAQLTSRMAWTKSLGLLAVAGLLRPETWLGSIAVAAWRWRRDPPVSRGGWALLVVLTFAGPALWMLVDLVLTGDPLFSLHGTRALADELARPRSSVLGPLLMTVYVEVLLGLPLTLAGALGIILLARTTSVPVVVMIAALLLSVAAFVALGFAGLPLLARYLLPAAALFAVAASAAMLPPSGSRSPALARATIAVLLVAALPGVVKQLGRAIEDTRTRRAVAIDLERLLAQPAFAAARERCRALTTGAYRLVPAVARVTGSSPASIAIAPDGLLLLPRSGRAALTLSGAADPEPAPLSPPRGFTLLVAPATSDWALAARCPARGD